MWHVLFMNIYLRVYLYIRGCFLLTPLLHNQVSYIAFSSKVTWTVKAVNPTYYKLNKWTLTKSCLRFEYILVVIYYKSVVYCVLIGCLPSSRVFTYLRMKTKIQDAAWETCHSCLSLHHIAHCLSIQTALFAFMPICSSRLKERDKGTFKITRRDDLEMKKAFEVTAEVHRDVI